MQVQFGPLPVTPGTTLSWLGFSEESLLTSYDSEVCLEHNLLQDSTNLHVPVV